MDKYANYIDRINSFKTKFRNNPADIFEEPTYLGFSLFFYFDNDESPLLNLKANSLSYGVSNSAYQFLLGAGYVTKAEMLKKFVEQLRKIQLEYPWYFQSISGIDELFNFDFTKNKVFGGNDSSLITITTLESLDMKIQQLLDLYVNSVFDYKNRREIVPENLRKFKLGIYIQDFREFQKYLQVDKNFNKKTLELNPEVKEIDINHLSRIFIEVNHCEITKSIGTMFASLSNADFSTPVGNAINIQYSGEVRTENFYNPLNFTVTTKSNENYEVTNYMTPNMRTITSNDIRSKIEEFGQRFMSADYKSLETYENGAKSLLNSKMAQSILLGNVYNKLSRFETEIALFNSVLNRLPPVNL